MNDDSWVGDEIPISNYPVELLNEIYTQVLALGNRLQAAAPPGRFISIGFATEPMLDPFAHSRGGAYQHQPGQLQTPAFPYLWYTSDISVPYGAWTDFYPVRIKKADSSGRTETEKELWQSYAKELNTLTSVVREKAFTLGLSKPSDPLYPNYVNDNTDIKAVYGDNLSKLREIAAKYDPEQVMTLTGGFLVQKGWSKAQSTETKNEL